jgi:hypothetical protein
MAKLVCDPTVDRKHTPLASNVVKAKIANNEVKVKGKQPKAKREEKPATAEPEKPKTVETTKFSDEQFLAALKTIDHPATSREISDKLGIENPEVGRQMVRTRMGVLAEQGKVKITKEGREYKFSLA